MPATTKATTLFSLDALKAWLGVTNTSKDGALVQIADGISERIESVTGRVFVTRSIAETRSGQGSARLFLRTFPIVSMSSLTYKSTPDQVTPTSLVQGTDYDLDGRIGVVALRSGQFPTGFQNVAVSYTAGFGAQDAATLPQDIYEAALNYAKAEWDELQTGAIAASSVSIGPSTMVLKPGLPPGLKSVLDVWTVRHIS